MNRDVSILTWIVATAMVVQGCQNRPPATGPASVRTFAADRASAEWSGRYVVLFAAERVPVDFGDRVSGLGGVVEAALDNIGVAIITGVSDSAAAELSSDPGVRNVERDEILRADAEVNPDADPTSELVAVADATVSPATAQFYARQWNLRAVSAPEAWAAGYLGSRDVVVAILDTGIDYLHPDFVGLVDLEHSRSFVPEEIIPARYPGRLPISDLSYHGTAVASVVASNAQILAGVNRYVTFLAVKITDSTFATSAGRIITGIMYAADQGADVINISTGSQRDKSTNPGAVAAFERAASYAFRKGAVVVSLPFNDGADLDHNGDIVRFPCEAAQVICVSATGPTGAASVNGPWENVDAIAPYSAFGRSAVSVAAPGGAGEVGQNRRMWVPCTTTPTRTTLAPGCLRNQLVVQPVGTSFAAPHVSGLAALLVSQLGHGNPALIRQRILQSADDVGQPGTDPFYGRGRINVARALGLGQ